MKRVFNREVPKVLQIFPAGSICFINFLFFPILNERLIIHFCSLKLINFFYFSYSKNVFRLSLNELKILYKLTHFENVIPCYLANVPSCWNEVKQAQKQRRHPQLLQLGSSEQHTRSWKLQIGE